VALIPAAIGQRYLRVSGVLALIVLAYLIGADYQAGRDHDRLVKEMLKRAHQQLEMAKPNQSSESMLSPVNIPSGR
jgi:hypothetical protein